MTVATGLGPFLVMQVTRDFVVAAATASDASRRAPTEKVKMICMMI